MKNFYIITFAGFSVCAILSLGKFFGNATAEEENISIRGNLPEIRVQGDNLEKIVEILRNSFPEAPVAVETIRSGWDGVDSAIHNVSFQDQIEKEGLDGIAEGILLEAEEMGFSKIDMAQDVEGAPFFIVLRRDNELLSVALPGGVVELEGEYKLTFWLQIVEQG